MNVVNILGRLGGLASRTALLDAGVTWLELGRACRDGLVVRINPAWYALPAAESAIGMRLAA